jgi:predicted acetyltransferase
MSGSAAAGRLVAPDARYRPSFLRSLAEYQAEGGYRELDAARLTDPAEFARFVRALHDDARGDGSLWRYLAGLTGRPPWRQPASGWAPQIAYWWTAGDEYLGRLNLRPRLTPDLLRRGGNIGYDVRPTARRRGHATAMVAAALPLLAARGIDPARVDCDDDNLASRRVIERNGGVLEREENGVLYFLVPTRPRP